MGKEKYKIIPVGEPGWRAVIASLDLNEVEERTDALHVHRVPLVGWWLRPDRGLGEPYLEPLVFAAALYAATQNMWGDLVEAEPISEIAGMHSGYVSYVLASWQDEPTEERMRVDAEEARKAYDFAQERRMAQWRAREAEQVASSA